MQRCALIALANLALEDEGQKSLNEVCGFVGVFVGVFDCECVCVCVCLCVSKCVSLMFSLYTSIPYNVCV